MKSMIITFVKRIISVILIGLRPASFTKKNHKGRIITQVLGSQRRIIFHQMKYIHHNVIVWFVPNMDRMQAELKRFFFKVKAEKFEKFAKNLNLTISLST